MITPAAGVDGVDGMCFSVDVTVDMLLNGDESICIGYLISVKHKN